MFIRLLKILNTKNLKQIKVLCVIAQTHLIDNI